jgi:hypothetical protein
VSSAFLVVLTPVSFTSVAFERSVSSVAGLDTKWLMTVRGLLFDTVKTGDANILVNFPRD